MATAHNEDVTCNHSICITPILERHDASGSSKRHSLHRVELTHSNKSGLAISATDKYTVRGKYQYGAT